MKLLSIVRHAKAERPDDYATDHERPLTKRGHADSRLVAAILANTAPAVDHIVSSTAARTQETVQEIISITGYQGATIWSDALYLATATELLRVLSESPADAEHVIICGHNPGMEELTAGLCAGGTNHVHLRMPTACCAHLQLEIVQWSQIRWGCGELSFLLPPKVLRT
ncbi:MAG: histidine phosphatase family protein [Caldilineaceae bacterium]